MVRFTVRNRYDRTWGPFSFTLSEIAPGLANQPEPALLTLVGGLWTVLLMTEVWLRPNRRVLLMAMIPVAALGVVSMALLISESATPPNWVSAVIAAISAGLFLGLLRECVRPRIAYHQGNILFYLKSGHPIAVPIGEVEAFFQGTSAPHLPGEAEHNAKSTNLIARLSRRKDDWHVREVKQALGSWEDGYVTIRGTWCEPIDEELIRQLNRRLSVVSKQQQEQANEATR